MHTVVLSVAFLLLLTGGALADEPGEEQAGSQAKLSTEQEAEARSAPGAIEEILITARKREEGGQSVPISISAFTGAELDAAQMRNLYTVAELTPNLEIRKVYVQARPAIYIRGVGTSDFGAEVASSVGIYKDGVYMALQPGIMFQTFDMERTEVLRGPQGTLYGKNTTGRCGEPALEAAYRRVRRLRPGHLRELQDLQLRGRPEHPDQRETGCTPVLREEGYGRLDG